MFFRYALSDIRVYLRPSSHIAGHIKNTRKEQHVLQIWEPGTHGLPHQCQDTCRTHTPHFKNKNVLSLCNIGEYRIHAHATQCVDRTHFKNIDVLSVCIMHHRTESRRIFLNMWRTNMFSTCVPFISTWYKEHAQHISRTCWEHVSEEQLMQAFSHVLVVPP